MVDNSSPPPPWPWLHPLWETELAQLRNACHRAALASDALARTETTVAALSPEEAKAFARRKVGNLVSALALVQEKAAFLARVQL